MACSSSIGSGDGGDGNDYHDHDEGFADGSHDDYADKEERGVAADDIDNDGSRDASGTKTAMEWYAAAAAKMMIATTAVTTGTFVMTKRRTPQLMIKTIAATTTAAATLAMQ